MRNSNNTLYFRVLVILGILMCFYIVSSRQSNENRISMGDEYLIKENTEISNNLKSTHNIMEVQKMAVAHTERKTQSIKSDPLDYAMPPTPNGVSTKDESFAGTVNKDIHKIESLEKVHSPEYSISKEIADDLYIDEREYETQQAYIDAFVANAKKAGYDIELNSNLDVVDIKRINKKQPLRFPQSVKVKSGSSSGSQ